MKSQPPRTPPIERLRASDRHRCVTAPPYDVDVRLSLGIVTDDVPRLRAFYESLLGAAAVDVGDYIEFRPGGDWVVGIVTTAAIDEFAPGAHVPGSDRSVRIELEVVDVDVAFERAIAAGGSVIAAPANFPWGNRAAWVNDPDGNIVSLWSVLASEGASA